MAKVTRLELQIIEVLAGVDKKARVVLLSAPARFGRMSRVVSPHFLITLPTHVENC